MEFLQIGDTYNSLTIKDFVETVDIGHKHTMNVYLCECVCGAIREFYQGEIISGHVKSCGCVSKIRVQPLKYDLTGQKFGRLNVINQAETLWSDSGKSRMIRWNCKCECGEFTIVNSRALRTSKTLSCGCYQKERVSDSLTDDLMGQKFGKLTVLERNGSYRGDGSRTSGVMAIWKCKCDCGNIISTTGYSLKCGDTISCGCLKSSISEVYISEILTELGFFENIDYFREKTFDDLISDYAGRLRFDFVIETNEYNVCIEYQGAQHYKSVEYFGGSEMFERRLKNDELKRVWCDLHGYQLVEIPYTVYTKSDIQAFLMERIPLN